jgi:hypothetical protein
MSRSGVATTTSTPGFERVDLLLARRTAVDGEHGAATGDGDGREHLGHLEGEFAGGHQHQCRGAAGLAVLRQAGQQRHAERERLAGAGLGAPSSRKPVGS